jgi:hypothetical protein
MITLQDIFDLLKDIELRIERIEASLDGDEGSYIEDWEEEKEDRSWDGDEGSYIEDLEEEKEDRSWDGG